MRRGFGPGLNARTIGRATRQTTPAPTPTPTPAPVFTVQPSISPTSGVAGNAFTASDGTASNTTGYTRRWLLSGTAIGTGTTVVPATSGSLVLEVTATGAGGSTIANSSAVTVSAAPSYDADAQAYFDAMTVQPDATRKGLINDFVVGMKADGNWTALDWIVLLASHDAQAARLNLRNPTKSLSAVNVPSFTVNRGYSGDAASSYLTMGEALNAAGNSYALDSCVAGTWCNLQGASTGLRAHFGKVGSGAPATVIRAHDTNGTNETYVLNDASSSVARASTGSRLGHRAIARPAANDKRSFFNGARTSLIALASTSTSATAHSVLRHDTVYTDDRIAAFYSGGGRTDAEITAIHNRLNTLLTPIGAN